MQQGRINYDVQGFSTPPLVARFLLGRLMQIWLPTYGLVLSAILTMSRLLSWKPFAASRVLPPHT